jgi:multidrug efflux system membrane fusion protein
MKPELPSELEPTPSGLKRDPRLAPLPKQPPRQRSSKRAWLWLPVLALLGAGAWYFWSRGSSSVSTAPPVSSKEGGRKGGGAIPVVATRARRGDIGVYVTGLGSVTPIYTVTLKSRVDGQLMNIRYKEGDVVRQNDLLVEIDERPYAVQLEQAEGQLARDQANLENARVDLDRYQKLLAQNAIPEQQLATQKAMVAQDEGIVKSDQGQIDAAKLNLVYCKITAPITGKVGLRLVDPGNIVHASDATGLLVITQLQPISVIFTISEDQLPAVAPRFNAGQKLGVEAWDRAGQRKIASGTLSTLDNQIDQTTGTLRLRAVFPNADNSLYPNQFVNTRMLVEQKRGVVLISTAALQRSTNGTFVYALKPDSSVTIRTVTVGTTEGEDSEVTSGLQAGDAVVETGVDKLNEGTHVVATFEGEAPAAAGSAVTPGGKAAANGKTPGKSKRAGGKKR